MIRASRHVLSQPVSARIEDGWTIRCLRHSADQLFERDLTRLANKSLHLDVEWLALAWAQCVRVSRRGYAVLRLMTAQCERFRVLFPSGDSALGWRGGRARCDGPSRQVERHGPAPSDESPVGGRFLHECIAHHRFALQAGWKSLCLPWRRWRDV